MTSKEFVIWLKGFTEACNDFIATPKQWDRIKEVLDEVTDDYSEQPGTFEDHSVNIPPYPSNTKPYRSPYDPPYYTGDPPGWLTPYMTATVNLTGSGTVSGIANACFTTGSIGATYNATVWNDKMGCWHYTNYPEGFGYYHRPENKKEKEILND